MRFTQEIVRRVSDYAREVSAGMLGDVAPFGLQGIGGNIGHGTRYIDGRQQLAWLGSRGARQAAAYYYGVAVAANAEAGRKIDDLPDWLREVAGEVAGTYAAWVDRGHADFMSAARWRDMRAEVRAEMSAAR